MALAITAPYSQVQSSYAVGCMREFANYINSASDFAPQSFVRDSVLLDFANKVAVRNGCRVYSNTTNGISLAAVDCSKGNYDLSKSKIITRSAPMTPFETAELMLECKLGCQGLDDRSSLMAFLGQLFIQLRRSVISTIDEQILAALSGDVTIDNCGSDKIVTAAQDGLITINATATGGLTDAVVGQILVALSENNALSGSAGDVLLVLPARAVEQWRASVPGNSLDFNDYQRGRLVNSIRGMYVYTPMDQKKVFVKGSASINGSTVSGIVAYALVRDAVRFGYKVPSSMFNDPGTNIVNVNVGYGVASMGANTFDTKRGLHFAYDLQCGALRQSSWGIVRILLPTNIFG